MLSFLLGSFLLFIFGACLPLNSTRYGYNAVTRSEFAASWPKRGLPFNNPPNWIRNFNGGGSQVNWAYSWDSNIDPNFPGYLEYIPMLHGHTRPWNDDVNRALSRGSGHIMAFNEPDNCGNDGRYMSNTPHLKKKIANLFISAVYLPKQPSMATRGI